MNRVTRIFMDTDLRCQHDGLRKIAKASKIDLDKLKPQEHVLFINQKRNKVKMYSASGVIGYYKQNHRLDIEAIAKIPHAYGDVNGLNYKKALKDVLKNRGIK